MEFKTFELGSISYHAYGDDVGWINFQGNPMPKWEELPEKIRHAWTAQAEKTIDFYLGTMHQMHEDPFSPDHR